MARPSQRDGSVGSHLWLWCVCAVVRAVAGVFAKAALPVTAGGADAGTVAPLADPVAVGAYRRGLSLAHRSKGARRGPPRRSRPRPRRCRRRRPRSTGSRRRPRRQRMRCEPARFKTSLRKTWSSPRCSYLGKQAVRIEDAWREMPRVLQGFSNSIFLVHV